MELFRNILSRLGISSPHPRPDALEYSSFNKLSTARELIFYLARFLPPESAAAFSLCCRPVYFTLGTQYLDDLKNNHADRYKFLTILEKEFSGYVTCYHCQKFHAIGKAHQHIHSEGLCFSWPGLPCWEADFDSLIWSYIHEDFSSTIFQMTMKLYRQGLDYSGPLSLLSNKTKTYFPTGYVEQRTALAKIVDGNLLLREQKTFLMPATQWDPFALNISFVICPHYKFYLFEDLAEYFYTVQAMQRPDGKAQSKPQGEKRLGQCRYCLSEFGVDFRRFGECGNAMYVTRWLDLGQGPFEDEYQSHVWSREGRSWLPWRFELGSICAAFEGKEHSHFDCDTLVDPKDRKELFKKDVLPGTYVASSQLPN